VYHTQTVTKCRRTVLTRLGSAKWTIQADWTSGQKGEVGIAGFVFVHLARPSSAQKTVAGGGTMVGSQDSLFMAIN